MANRSKNSIYVKILVPRNNPSCPPISPANKKINHQFPSFEDIPSTSCLKLLKVNMQHNINGRIFHQEEQACNKLSTLSGFLEVVMQECGNRNLSVLTILTFIAMVLA